jgi:hypothetical protein
MAKIISSAAKWALKKSERALLHTKEKGNIFANRFGTIAQMVEQRTENPCVPGSIPGGTTDKSESESYSSHLTLFLFA